MATRSTIAIELSDGKVKQIYCHWDGYLDHNGDILLNHYSDPLKAEAMITLGDISSLAPDYDPGNDDHSFDSPKLGVTIYYGRDRGETDVGYRLFHDFEHYKRDHQYEEYEYILRNDGKWYVSCYERPYVLLSDAIADEMIEEELAEDE